MNIREESKIGKQLRKLQPQVVKKYAALLKELKISGLNANYPIEKLQYNKEYLRIKLDYRHRVKIKIEGVSLLICEVSSRENFYCVK